MSILLVDDHALFREGLALLMAQRFPLMQVMQAGSLAEAVATAAQAGGLRLVLLDLSLPDSEGLMGLAVLREAAPQAMVVVLSADDRPETVMAAIDAGAAGFIPKTANAAELQSALQVAMVGGVSLPASMVSRREASEGAQATLGLSPRQLDVLQLLVEGRPNKLICRELNLSESTVKTHVAAIFRKLGVNSRTQAVVAVARPGLRRRTAE